VHVKGLGYAISMVSVGLLAVPAWKSASQDSLLFLCLVGGVAAAITGMALRWADYRREQSSGR